MTVKWIETQIGNLGQVFTGRTPSTKHPEYFGNEYFFITPGDMHQGKHILTTERCLSSAGAKLLHRIQLPAKSICVSCIGWQMGEVVMTSATSFTNQQINSIVPNSDVDANFIYYSLVPRKQELLALASGIGVRTPILNKSEFCKLRIMLPPLPVQKKIAGVLSAYDDLIENNTRRIKILEEMAQSIYQEWFVNFRFPGHENVKMVDSPLGLIPEGWEVVSLKDIVEYQNRKTRAGIHLQNRYYVPIECIPRNSLTLLEAKSWIEAQSSLQLFERDDIIFGAMRPYFHKVVIAPFSGVTRNTCFVLKPRYESLLSYALLTVFKDESIEYANSHSQGATIPYTVWQGSFSEMPVLLPPKRLIDKFAEIVMPMIRSLQSQFFRLNDLRQTRDLLLPKLISGEVDVLELDIDMGASPESESAG